VDVSLVNVYVGLITCPEESY